VVRFFFDIYAWAGPEWLIPYKGLGLNMSVMMIVLPKLWSFLEHRGYAPKGYLSPEVGLLVALLG
jgi:hypothetical protein